MTGLMTAIVHGTFNAAGTRHSYGDAPPAEAAPAAGVVRQYATGVE